VTRTRDAVASDNYADRLSKILPAELTATYFLLRALAGSNPQLTFYLLILSLVLMALFFFIAPRLVHLITARNRILYCVTFVFWVLAIDAERFALDIVQSSGATIPVLVFVASGLAAIWSFAVPFLMEETA
jgi:hypothetical protein